MTLVSRARSWLPLLPLLGLLAVTYWLNQQVQPEPAKPDPRLRHDPDAFMDNFSAVRFNRVGQTSYIMSAKKLEHYPDDDSTTLDAPQLTSVAVGRPSIHVVARRGTVANRGDEVFLHEDVEVLREASAEREQMTLETEYLHVIPDRDWADSNQPVLLRDPHNTINAVGLEMDNRQQTLKLLSQVRSTHERVRQ